MPRFYYDFLPPVPGCMRCRGTGDEECHPCKGTGQDLAGNHCQYCGGDRVDRCLCTFPLVNCTFDPPMTFQGEETLQQAIARQPQVRVSARVAGVDVRSA